MLTTSEAIQKLLKSDDDLQLENYIDGGFVPTPQHLDSFDPSRGRPWVKIPRSTASDVDAAVRAAKRAFKEFAELFFTESSATQMVADIVEANLEGFAQLESRDQGKPVSLARTIDIPRCIHNFRFFASAVLHHLSTSTVQTEPIKALNYVLHDPVGVAGLISPWNLPLYLVESSDLKTLSQLSFKLAPALATGNTVVAKPSELTSATAWVLMHSFHEAGFPPGVVNLIIGTGPEAGEPLVIHPDVGLVSFTGSTLIGKRIAGLCAPFNKKISLEMGGKNACVVYPSTNLASAIPVIAKSSFINQGEICLCSSRIFVHEQIFDTFLRAFLEETKKFTVGDPRGNSTLGAMNSLQHYNKVVSYIEVAKEDGAEIHCGGALKLNDLQGYYIAPTVITGISDDSRVMKEEIFGPVVVLTPFSTSERANATPYGLSVCVWSEKADELHATAAALRVGTVWCNTWMTRDLNMPFGGTKESGIGREGAFDSFHFFTEPKTVCLKLA